MIIIAQPIKVLPVNTLLDLNDLNKTASDSEITVNSIEHHLSDSITSVENPNVKTCNCITRLESLKDEFNLKAVNIKKTWFWKLKTYRMKSRAFEKILNLHSIKM